MDRKRVEGGVTTASQRVSSPAVGTVATALLTPVHRCVTGSKSCLSHDLSAVRSRDLSGCSSEFCTTRLHILGFSWTDLCCSADDAALSVWGGPLALALAYVTVALGGVRTS